MSDLRQLHDRLLEQKPDDAVHDRELCSFCSTTEKPGGVPQVYTEEQLQAAVLEATATLADQVRQMQTAALETDIEARIEAVRAEALVQVEELRASLDTAVLERQNAANELEAMKASAVEAETEAARLAEIASRRDERVARVQEVASFPDEYLTANADRFAAMSDEDFEDRLAEWASLSPKESGGIPKRTALHGVREVASDQRVTTKDAIKAVMGLRFNGVDTRNI